MGSHLTRQKSVWGGGTNKEKNSIQGIPIKADEIGGFDWKPEPGTKG